ncbi:DnaD domain protein [Anaerobacillus sp. HL2]|nr:DnaD domain protein [Anaerobacillus sp. HL2]
MLTCEEKVEKNVFKKEVEERLLYQLFETEFGRPLSPMECELITMWLDQNYSLV